MGSTVENNNQARSLVSASTYSIAEIFKNVNTADKHFLKYLPDGFLSEEQIKAKQEALAEDKRRIDAMSDKEQGKKETITPVKNLTKEQKDVVEAGKRIGREVVIADIKRGNKNIDGLFDGKILYINPNPTSGNPMFTLLKHELTHFTQISEKYRAFSVAVTDSKVFSKWLKDKGFKNSQEYIAKIISDRKQLGENWDNEKGRLKARREMVGDFVGDVLFAEDGALERFVNALSPDHKRTFGELVRDFIAWIKKKLGALSEIEMLERQYAKLFKDAKKVMTVNGEYQAAYSFINSSNGMANDALIPYNDKQINYINNRGDYIIDSFDKLVEVVNLAFDEPDKKAIAHFGMVDAATLQKIKNSIPNLPESMDMLFEDNRSYSIATTLDSIRHIVKEKKLTRQDVIDYLDRFANTIVEYDEVDFHYYTRRGRETPGLLFRKDFPDGKYISFDLISQEKQSLLMQSLYIDSVDYEKRKSADPVLMQNAPASTPKARGGQTSNTSISQKSDLSTDSSKKTSGTDDSQLSYTPTEENGVDNYTEEQYNSFGWVRANNVISAGYWRNFTQNFAKAVTGLSYYPKNAQGEYMIEVYDIHDSFGVTDVIVFASGTIENPKVTKIVKLNLTNDVDLETKRSELYEVERRGIQQEAGELFRFYYKADFVGERNYQRNSAEGIGNNHRLGTKRRPSEIKANPLIELHIDEENGTIITKYRNGEILTERWDVSDYSYTPSKAETIDELLEQYKEGTITEEEFKERIVSGKSKNDPVSVAQMKEESANTTPDIQRRQVKVKGDGERDTIIAKGKASIFSEGFKKEVETDEFIQKYKTITNEETLKMAAEELDREGDEGVQNWLALNPVRASVVDIVKGFILLDRYRRLGNVEGQVRVAQKISDMGTAAGQSQTNSKKYPRTTTCGAILFLFFSFFRDFN